VRKSWLFRIGLGLVVIAVFLALFGHRIAPYPVTVATPHSNLPPSAEHWFGTDPSGFDVFSRVLAAARIDVTVALAATVLSVVVGSVIGLFTSFFGGWFGEVFMRGSDTVQAFPLFVLAIIVVTMSGRHLWNIVVVIAILNVPIYIRLVRSQVLSLREQAFVEAAHAAGNSGVAIALRHVLPNAIGPTLAQSTVTMGGAVLVIAGLSFIGAGVQPPTPEWGAMIAAGANGIIIGQWWESVFPGIVLSLTVFGFAIVGEGLQTILRERA
jgi:peptide/nickel transport system permease protein